MNILIIEMNDIINYEIFKLKIGSVRVMAILTVFRFFQDHSVPLT